MDPKIITVTMNPAIDKIVTVEDFAIGQTNRIKSVRLDPGGKGINVSKALQSYGVAQVATGILAGRNGKTLLTLLKDYKFRKDFLMVPGETRINLKIRDLNSGSITEVNEPGHTLRTEDMEVFFRKLKKYLQKSEIVVFSGSLPLETTDFFYTAAIQMAVQMNSRVIFDADRSALKIGIQSKPHAIKPNLSELERLTGKVLDTYDKIRIEVERLAKTGIEIILVSMGEKGAVFHSKGTTWRVSPLEVEVKSTIGAGDAMVAALAYCMLNDLPPEVTARMTVAAGCLTAAKEGSDMADWQDIRAVYEKVNITEL